MNPSPLESHARLAVIALAVAVGPLVVGRSLPDEGAPPALEAPSAAGQGSRASAESTLDALSPPAGRAERAVPPRLSTRLADDADPLESRSADSGSSPETEVEHYEHFLATWRAGGDARLRLEGRATDVLRGPGASAEKVALLRALRDAGSDAVPELLELALTELPDRPGPRGVSVPAFVVSRLGQVRISDAERAVLESAVHNSSGNLAPNTRGRALCVLIESADERGHLALASALRIEADPLVRAMGEQALRSKRDREVPTSE